MARIFLIGLVVWLGFSCSVAEYRSNATPIAHDTWTSLLQQHVDTAGWVDYPGFIRDSAKLNEYLRLLSNHHPDPDRWTENERKAYWINAYNAFTVKLITEHYPVDGIKKIKPGIPFVNTVWDIKFIDIAGQKYDLNNIEHGILRPRFKDARVHFALNCASVSCPILWKEAFTAKDLDNQLNEAGRSFLDDQRRNQILPEDIKVSRIFKWYQGDFVSKEQGLIDFLNQFSSQKIEASARISYLPYNWQLNEEVNAPNGAEN